MTITAKTDFDAMLRADESAALADRKIVALAQEALKMAWHEGRKSTAAELSASAYGSNSDHNVRIERLEFFVNGCKGQRGGLVGYMTRDDVIDCATRVMRRVNK